MAKTKELTFNVTLTVNLGHYESAKVEVGEVVELEEDDDAKKEMARLVKRVKGVVEHEAEILRKELSTEKAASSKKK